MYDKDTTIGALTNMEHWIVLERDRDTNEITVSRVDATKEGPLNLLNILLAITISA